MKVINKKAGSAAAFGAAVALACVGLGVSPAAANEVSTATAPVDGVAYDQFVKDLVATDAAIVGIGQNAEGDIVVSAQEDKLEASTLETLEGYDNVVLKDRKPLTAFADTDVVGGAGYFTPILDQPGYVALCSFGFSGWTPDGEPAVITAGHCADVGAQVRRTVPAGDDAATFPEENDNLAALDAAPIGTFGFSQWGGPGGTEGANGELTSTDIAAIDITDDSLTLLPKVTDWSDTSDLSTSGTTITSVGTVKAGDQITRSGRTTGQHSGQVIDPTEFNDPENPEEDVTVLEDKTWLQICEEVDDEGNGTNCHWVYGFVTDALSDHGDSGGAYMRGNTAVGVLSGGDDEISFATDLVNGLEQTGGYTVMLDLDEPVVTSTATINEGGNITGTGTPGLTVVVTIDGTDYEATVAADGSWSVAAPAPGTYTATVVAKDDGYNVSDEVSYAFEVVAASDEVEAPVFTSPADGTTVSAPVSAITGTGTPGATVTLSGDATGTATVAEDGTWSVAVNLGAGEYTVSAVQTVGDETSAAATLTFTVEAAPVVVAPPVITSPADGSSFTADKAPTTVTGTGVPGGEVIIYVSEGTDGTEYGPVTVAADGTWSLPITAPGVGEHEIVAQQSTADGTSEIVTVNFTVTAVEDPGGELPQTGMDAGWTAGAFGIGGLVLLVGAALVITARMRAGRSAAE